jgi:hypothetical protein
MLKYLGQLIAVAGGLMVWLAGQPVQAASFTLDFEMDPLGNDLDPLVLDSSNSTVDIGSLWSSIGITISTANTNAPLGLFDSNCLPQGGTSHNGFTVPCNTSPSLGDPDLATGNGSYGSISYNTPPQGNLLILEENPGNGIPDDTANGGTILFTFDRTVLNSVKIGEIVFVDDAQGSIKVFFLDGSFEERFFDIDDENGLFSATNFADKEVESFSINFDGSGGIGAIVFTDFDRYPEAIPFETKGEWGALVACGLLGLLRLKKQVG